MSERSASYRTAREPAPLPPHDIAAEEAVLGSIVLACWLFEEGEAVDRTGSAVYREVRPIVQAVDFFSLKHREVWEAIERCITHGREPDRVTVAHELHDYPGLPPEQSFEECLWLLIQLGLRTPTPIHARHYAQIVRETADCRRAIQQGGMIAAAAFNKDMATVRRLQQDASIVVNKRRKGGAVDA